MDNKPKLHNQQYILMAEDDLEDQFIMTDAFKEVGLDGKIVFVENGEHVLEYLQSHSDTLPALVVLDLNMPLMNGTQTLRSLKQSEAFQKLPVIIYSTSLNLIEMEECMRLGADSYTIKPNTFTECKQIAERFFDFCCNKYSFPTIEEMMKTAK
jgi:CheY-like chemotaxis protein